MARSRQGPSLKLPYLDWMHFTTGYSQSSINCTFISNSLKTTCKMRIRPASGLTHTSQAAQFHATAGYRSKRLTVGARPSIVVCEEYFGGQQLDLDDGALCVELLDRFASVLARQNRADPLAQ